MKYVIMYLAKLEAEGQFESVAMYFKELHHSGEPIFAHRTIYAHAYDRREDAERDAAVWRFQYNASPIARLLTVVPMEAA